MRKQSLLYRAAFLAALFPSLTTVCFAQTNAPCDILASATPCVENQAATTSNGSPKVIDDYCGEATSGLQMWLDTANGQAPQNWLLNIQ